MDEQHAIARLKRGDIDGLETLVRMHQLRPGRIIYVQQTQQADGITATLERVTVAPSGTTAIVCLDPPYAGNDWHADAELQTADGGRIGWNDLVGVEREGCYAINFNEAFADASGTWTLSVTTLEGTSGWMPKQRGPWTWTFDVPQP